jgi:hypothetical protein
MLLLICKPTTKRNKVIASVIVPLSTLGPVDPETRPKELGKHGESVWIDRGPLGPLNIVAMDPGQATLVDAIRSHHDGIPASMAPNTLPANPSKNQNRRHHLEDKLAQKSRIVSISPWPMHTGKSPVDERWLRPGARN